MNHRESYCTFEIDDFLFGIEVQKVQEVIRCYETTRVPLAPPIVSGIMNLRGQIVTTLNLGHTLGLSQDDPSNRKMIVVVRSTEGPVSLMVDQIGDVVETAPAQRETIPGNLRSDQRELMKGAYKLDGRLLLVLNIDRIISVAA